ncbi:SLC13 family permease [Streptomyces sp. NPDC006175]|uniref:SLC13 family permease n=1 Tax=unclassified Streptomyces TaxID=2593676 RepID=UPI0033BAAB53
MSPELWSIFAAIGVFVIGTTMNVNLGLLGAAAAFILGITVADLPPEELTALFPGDMFLLVVSLMFLLAIVRLNGTVDWFVGLAIAGVRGRVALIPWLLFVLAAVMTSMGPAALPLLAGMGAVFVKRYHISPLLSGIMIVHGTQAGGLSPVTPYSAIVRGIVEKAGYNYDAWELFGTAFLCNTVIAAVGFYLVGGKELLKRRHTDEGHPADQPAAAEGEDGAGVMHTGESADTSTSGGSVRGGVGDAPLSTSSRSATLAAPTTTPSSSTVEMRTRNGNLKPTPSHLISLAGIVVFISCVGFFKTDLAMTALFIAIPLALMNPSKMRSDALDRVSWSAVTLICGMLLFVAVLEAMGTMTYIADALQSVGSGLVALLLVCYLGAIISTFASSIGTLAIAIPIGMAVLEPLGLSGIQATLIAAAIAISATVVDISPFSFYGAVILGAAEPAHQPKYQKSLMKYAGVMVVLAPAAVWAAIALPVWLLR